MTESGTRARRRAAKVLPVRLHLPVHRAKTTARPTSTAPAPGHAPADAREPGLKVSRRADRAPLVRHQPHRAWQVKMNARQTSTAPAPGLATAPASACCRPGRKSLRRAAKAPPALPRCPARQGPATALQTSTVPAIGMDGVVARASSTGRRQPPKAVRVPRVLLHQSASQDKTTVLSTQGAKAPGRFATPPASGHGLRASRRVGKVRRARLGRHARQAKTSAQTQARMDGSRGRRRVAGSDDNVSLGNARRRGEHQCATLPYSRRATQVAQRPQFWSSPPHPPPWTSTERGPQAHSRQV